MSVILELSDILVSPLPGVKFTMATDATSKSDSVSGIALFEKSSTAGLMATYTFCLLSKLSVGFTLTTVFPVLMVASNEISLPLVSVSLSTMKLSMSSSSSGLSSRFLIFSLKVRETIRLIATFDEPLSGSKTTVGGLRS